MTKELQKEFTSFQLNNIHPLLNKWSTKVNIKKVIEAEISEQIDWIENKEFAQNFYSSCKDLNIPSSNFNNRLIYLDNKKKFIAGIRFKNMDLRKPFIEITTNFEITENNFETIANKLKKEFNNFSPIAYQVWIPFKQTEHLFNHNSIKTDQIFFAQKVSEIKKLKLPESFENLSLIKAENLDFYPNYLKLYKQYNLKYSEIGSEIRIEEKDDFIESLEQNLLFEIFIDTRWAGIIAAEHGSFKGIKGIFIREEIISDKFRGKSYGVAIQRHLVEKLPYNKILFGTIHSKNIPSQKTAQRNGRIKMGADFMISIDFPESNNRFFNL